MGETTFEATAGLPSSSHDVDGDKDTPTGRASLSRVSTDKRVGVHALPALAL